MIVSIPFKHCVPFSLWPSRDVESPQEDAQFDGTSRDI